MSRMTPEEKVVWQVNHDQRLEETRRERAAEKAAAAAARAEPQETEFERWTARMWNLESRDGRDTWTVPEVRARQAEWAARSARSRSYAEQMADLAAVDPELRDNPYGGAREH